MHVRRAIRGDLPTLFAIYRTAFPVPWFLPSVVERWLRERELAALVAANSSVYVLDLGAGPVGSVHLRRVGQDDFEVNNFCIRQDVDGVGIFSWANFVLEAIIDCASGLPVRVRWTSLKPGFGEACNRVAHKIGLKVTAAPNDSAALRQYLIDRIPSYCARYAA